MGAAQQELFQARVLQLLLDMALTTAAGVLLTFAVTDGSVADCRSYGIGAVFGTGYLVLLARFVDGLGRGGMAGGGGSARFALPFLVLLASRAQPELVHPLPALAGYFSYQVSVTLQAFKKQPGEDLLKPSEDEEPAAYKE